MDVNNKENENIIDKISIEAKELIKQIKNKHMEEQFGEWMQGIEDGTISRELVAEYMQYLLERRKKAGEYVFKELLFLSYLLEACF